MVQKCASCERNFGDAIYQRHLLECKGKPVAAAKPDPSKALPKASVPKVDDADRSIVNLYRKNRGDLKPIYRINDTYLRAAKSLINSSGPSGTALSVAEDMVKRLVTALSFVEKEGLFDASSANKVTIREFMGLDENGQLKVVNTLWNECTTAKTYNCRADNMLDNNNEVTASQSQLPSSIVPGKQGGSPFVWGRQDEPFKLLGIGFRCDGMAVPGQTPDSVDRARVGGLQAQVLNPAFILNYRGYMVANTTVENTSSPRIYARAQDLFNETAVCVARSLFGATAFPERAMDAEKDVAVFAVDVFGLRGFDTEKHQLDIKKPWRPGEKCFKEIPREQVIGYVLVRRPAGPRPDGGWSFRIAKGATWTWLNGVPKLQARAYLESVLGAWATGETHDIPDDYDFEHA